MHKMLGLMVAVLALFGMIAGCGGEGREVEIELDPEFHNQEPREMTPEEEEMWREQQEEMRQ